MPPWRRCTVATRGSRRGRDRAPGRLGAARRRRSTPLETRLLCPLGTRCADTGSFSRHRLLPRECPASRSDARHRCRRRHSRDDDGRHRGCSRSPLLRRSIDRRGGRARGEARAPAAGRRARGQATVRVRPHQQPRGDSGARRCLASDDPRFELRHGADLRSGVGHRRLPRLAPRLLRARRASRRAGRRCRRRRRRHPWRVSPRGSALLRVDRRSAVGKRVPRRDPDDATVGRTMARCAAGNDCRVRQRRLPPAHRAVARSRLHPRAHRRPCRRFRRPSR
jgi:hypothetical protein